MAISVSGHLAKMHGQLDDQVQYILPVDDQRVPLNELLGKSISLEYLGDIHCIHCGRRSKKSFSQGYCYPCFTKLPQCDTCIMSPEKCHYHHGTCRDPAWGDSNCFTDHFVYLANSSGVKVGITRGSQGIIRWMDQGASQAILLAEVPNRRFSGEIEVSLKKFVADATNWRRMLAGTPEPIDLVKMKEELSIYIPEKFKKYILSENRITEIKYPVIRYPNKIRSVKLENTPTLEGTLLGIKGQYLLLNEDRVFNIRSHEGFISKFSIEEVSQGTLF